MAKREAVVRPRQKKGGVLGVRRNGTIVRAGEPESSSEYRRIERPKEDDLAELLERFTTPKRDTKEPKEDLATLLAQADVACYGRGRVGGGPDPTFDDATTPQLLNRWLYYDKDADLEDVKAMTDDAAKRRRAQEGISEARRRLGTLPAPRLPPWAARGCFDLEQKIRRLDGVAGTAWLDTDGKLDDWIAYLDDDALPPRPAEYSPLRRLTRWAKPVDPPNSMLPEIRRVTGSILPSQTSSSSRGGAVLDDYGYVWGQSHSEASLFVALPPGTEKRDVLVTVTYKSLLVGVKLANLLASPFAKYHLSNHPSSLSNTPMQTLLHGSLFAAVDAAASTWVLDTSFRVRRPGPLGSVLHPVLVVTLPKAINAWWQSLLKGHPTVRPRDFDFLDDLDDE